MRRLLILLGAIVLVASCSPTDEEETTTSESPATSVTLSTGVVTTTSLVSSTTSSTIHGTTTSSVSETTIEPVSSVAIEDVVAMIQSQLDEEFAASDPPHGVLGPTQVQCLDSGSVNMGNAFACAGIPQTEKDFQLDTVGIVFYVIDDTPTVAWLPGTDVPDTTEGLLSIYDETPKDLYCRDLLAEDPSTWFDGYGSVPATGYFLSLLYWSLEGQPDRMDADGNGIPCETLWPADVIEDVIDGGELH